MSNGVTDGVMIRVTRDGSGRVGTGQAKPQLREEGTRAREADGEVTDALGVLLDLGLVASRSDLNRAWLELTGRAVPTAPEGLLCARCGLPGAWRYLEPKGVWHHRCWPSLWRGDGGWTATPRCRVCGAPGGSPRHPSGRASAPCCREHAPAWLKSYLDGEARR